MSSHKSSPADAPARAPQRRRGELRVAALMEAGAAVFAEKGYEAATMTEIAAQANAPIGSLYQFFPSKDALADALLVRYGEQVNSALAEIEAQAATISAADLAASLMGLLVTRRVERATVIALMDARGLRASGLGLRDVMRTTVARILAARRPELSPERAPGMAVVLVQLMKDAVVLSGEAAARPDALDELRRMAEIYLTV